MRNRVEPENVEIVRSGEPWREELDALRTEVSALRAEMVDASSNKSNNNARGNPPNIYSYAMHIVLSDGPLRALINVGV